MSEPLKVGVVGLGIRGFWVAHMTRGCPETRLVAMADMRPEILDIARDKFPDVDLYASGEEMARDAAIDAVFVTTGDRFHAGNAREALRCGKHVLIEKPMAQSFADLEEIARLKQETGLTVGTFLELRHSPLWQRTREILESGTIGRVLSAALVDHVGRDRSQFFARRKARSRDQVVSLVLQKGVHSLDLLNWFVASSPRRVSASVASSSLAAGARREAVPRLPHLGQCPHFLHQPAGRARYHPGAWRGLCVWYKRPMSRTCRSEYRVPAESWPATVGSTSPYCRLTSPLWGKGAAGCRGQPDTGKPGSRSPSAIPAGSTASGQRATQAIPTPMGR